MVIICDIDYTCANASKRYKKAGKEPTRRSKLKYQEWLDHLQSPKDLLNDEPYTQVRNILWAAVNSKQQLIYLTGRSSLYKDVTDTWLRENKFPITRVLTRTPSDYSSAVVYKEEQVKRIIEHYGESETYLAIDDDYAGDCSKMYKKHNILHLKVMP